MRILVLGDSSSSGIGAGEAVYPFKLYSLLRRRLTVHVENHAVPGATSSDLARHYGELDDRNWDYVIVYIGNNEGSRSKYKGAYRKHWSLGLAFSRKAARRASVTIEDRPQFVFEYEDAGADIANHPDDFRVNLAQIAARAGRDRSRLIVINPIANREFPAAMGSPRAPFLKIVGFDTRVAGQLVAVDDITTTLVDGIALHEQRRFAPATERYRALLGSRAVVATVARNNLAVLMAETRATDEAIALLEEIDPSDTADRAIALYNLGRIYRGLGRTSDAAQCYERAAEADRSLYRIKDVYRREITALSAPHIRVLDAAGLLDRLDFIDYCHPTEAGHDKLARAIANVVSETLWSGTSSGPSTYECRLPSPDAFFEPAATLLDYYSVEPDRDEDIAHETRELLARLGQATLDLTLGEPAWPAPQSVVQHNILHAWQHALDHPLFTHVGTFGAFTLQQGYEVGRFPEFYVYGIVLAYLRHAEAGGWLGEIMSDDERARWGLSPDTYQSRILSAGPRAIYDVNLSMDYCTSVMARTRAMLQQNTRIFADRRAHRIATIMYWYTREAFRYGTQSRLGMLYERWQIDKVVEGLCVCAVIARHHGRSDVLRDVRSIVEEMAALVDVHEEHARKMIESGFEETDSDDYQRRLEAARQRLSAQGVTP